jgi:hypothetical protein
MTSGTVVAAGWVLPVELTSLEGVVVSADAHPAINSAIAAAMVGNRFTKYLSVTWP